jgi:cytochrome c biogenesis protein CcdA
MDDSERDGLLQYIRQLEHTARRWRTIAMTAFVVLGIFVLAGVIGVGATSFFVTNRARQEAIIARDRAAIAESDAMAAREQAERLLAADRQKQAEAAKKGKGKS